MDQGTKSPQQLLADLDVEEPDSPAYPLKKQQLLQLTPWTRKHSKSLSSSINPSLTQSRKNLNQVSSCSVMYGTPVRSHERALNCSITESFITRRRSRYLQATNPKPTKPTSSSQKQIVRTKTISQLVDLNKSVTPSIPCLNHFKRQTRNNSNLLSFWYRKKVQTENSVPERKRIFVRGKKLNEMRQLLIVPSKSFQMGL